jgi:hypothetical protein
MTMLVYAEMLRFLYAFSIRWPGLLARGALLTLVGAVVFAAWRLRPTARKTSVQLIVTNQTPRRMSL